MNVNMGNVQPTVDEIFALLKKSSLPTVLVEGKDDIIFYRNIEDELQQYNIDILPAGNKAAVLDLRNKLNQADYPVDIPLTFVVDQDLWVHATPECCECPEDVITTDGYSIENDLFIDGELESLLTLDEKYKYHSDLERFIKWYALSVWRSMHGQNTPFRTNPFQILNNPALYAEQTALTNGESYPQDFYETIHSSYLRLLRGKSLISILLLQLTAPKRKVKFSSKQLIMIGAARKGKNFQRICGLIETALGNTLKRAV